MSNGYRDALNVGMILLNAALIAFAVAINHPASWLIVPVSGTAIATSIVSLAERHRSQP